jgi:F-type H+-transporting ATPase subunit delta
MNVSAAAKRYADGFLEYARGAIGFEKGLSELLGAKAIFRDNPDLMDFLDCPEITYAEKVEMVEDIFRADFSEATRNFLVLLLKKGRIEIFDDIAEYARIKYSHGGEIEALLETTYELDAGVTERVKSAIENKWNKKLHLYIKLEPELLGGVRVTVGNTVIDGSVKKRLEDLKDKLMAVKVD